MKTSALLLIGMVASAAARSNRSHCQTETVSVNPTQFVGKADICKTATDAEGKFTLYPTSETTGEGLCLSNPANVAKFERSTDGTFVARIPGDTTLTLSFDPKNAVLSFQDSAGPSGSAQTRPMRFGGQSQFCGGAFTLLATSEKKGEGWCDANPDHKTTFKTTGGGIFTSKTKDGVTFTFDAKTNTLSSKSCKSETALLEEESRVEAAEEAVAAEERPRPVKKPQTPAPAAPTKAPTKAPAKQDVEVKAPAAQVVPSTAGQETN